jgi:hypothetical protein
VHTLLHLFHYENKGFSVKITVNHLIYLIHSFLSRSSDLHVTRCVTCETFHKGIYKCNNSLSVFRVHLTCHCVSKGESQFTIIQSHRATYCNKKGAISAVKLSNLNYYSTQMIRVLHRAMQSIAILRCKGSAFISVCYNL